MKSLRPYLRHFTSCSAQNSNPIDERCICGLRNVYIQLEYNYENPSTDQRLIGIVRYMQRVDQYGVNSELGRENLRLALELSRGL